MFSFVWRIGLRPQFFRLCLNSLQIHGWLMNGFFQVFWQFGLCCSLVLSKPLTISALLCWNVCTDSFFNLLWWLHYTRGCSLSLYFFYFLLHLYCISIIRYWKKAVSVYAVYYEYAASRDWCSEDLSREFLIAWCSRLYNRWPIWRDPDEYLDIF